MGTDVDFLIERKIGDIWVYDEKCLFDLYYHRNYLLFAILGFARRGYENIIPISPMKGLPENCSSHTKSFYNGIHQSFSYLTLAEIFNYDWKIHEGCGDFWSDIITQMTPVENFENVRLIFTFDF